MKTGSLLKQSLGAALLLFAAIWNGGAQAASAEVVKAQDARTATTVQQAGAALPKSAKGKTAPANTAVCYECHKDIQQFHEKNKHATVNCAQCHGNLDKHVAMEGKGAEAEVTVRTEHEACGTCHRAQYDSFTAVNLESKARVEKASFKSRSPLFDKLIAGHGFAKEHAEPRSHVFMLVDHLIVDRAYGGRFQLKDWTYIIDGEGAEKDAHSVLKDRDPKTNDHKPFMPQSAAAANPVCLQCKSQDNILKWKYMGDKDPKAKFDRTSNTVDVARGTKHGLNCFQCHDPHSTAPRVVRDALIEAVVDRGEGTYPYDKKKSQKTTMTKVTFRDGFRAIGILNKPDSNLMCAQCHVEYNCNPGFDTRTGEYSVKMDDRRTNYFPWVNVFDYKGKMQSVNFKDFKHAGTGALLSKLQHPETETYWNSKHERAGVECKDCHMPKVKAGRGQTYTWHGQKSARYMTKDTCLGCHEWTEKEAEYQIDAIQNYIRGKITKAEFWLGQFIDTFAKAKSAGVSEEILNKARAHHDQAHIYWEWWTAENSDGFHNPTAARESLARSMDESQAGIKLLSEAMAKK